MTDDGKTVRQQQTNRAANPSGYTEHLEWTDEDDEIAERAREALATELRAEAAARSAIPYPPEILRYGDAGIRLYDACIDELIEDGDILEDAREYVLLGWDFAVKGAGLSLIDGR